MAGLRPGFGRGGMTHSLDVTDVCATGAGELAADMGFIDSCRGRAGANGAGDAAVKGVVMFWEVAMVCWSSIGRLVKRQFDESAPVAAV